jgi:hypothetical protein
MQALGVIPDSERLVTSESKKYTYDYIRAIDWNQLNKNNIHLRQETYENISTRDEGSILNYETNQYQNIFDGNGCTQTIVTAGQGRGLSRHSSAVRTRDDNDLGIYNALNHENRSVRRPKSDDPAYSHMQVETDHQYTLLCGEPTMAKPKRTCDKIPP